ncbi:PAS domain-containing protein [Roseovarius azorensis]|uniref:PAS domain-containing protein n=1 Tax=Roseovarius azorensis TaxID=1287727 RepID=A0A1H7K6M1_9RHOB|nr:PAS-domain containing protein [Roseovarius azorensis]SEK82479.1 PAS domain-containing protein [Roseovarius azorensis]
MADLTWADGLFLASLTLVVCIVALLVLGMAGPRSAGGQRPDLTGSCSNHFLFRDERLIDHDASGFSLPDPDDTAQTDWARFRAWLTFRFPDLPVRLADLDPDRATSLHSQSGDIATRLDLCPSRRTVHVTLTDTAQPEPAIIHERLRLCQSLQDQSAALFHAPCPVWIRDKAGETLWQNEAGEAMNPDHRAEMLRAAGQPPAPGDTVTERISLVGDNGRTETSYDLRVTGTDRGLVLCATDVTRIVRAETARRDFVQTLSRTFASLTVGLTVFDRDRTLALFNPAMIDLTGLAPEFLSSRPGLISFFDALRDRQVMPEPRNYGNWRSQINDMVRTARGGLYQEVWSLTTGQIYRVTGRPHPDGDVAFVFEDISVEISTMRRHRAQIDLRQSVLDRLTQGIAVLSGEGRLMFCNTAFGILLGIDPDSHLAGMGLHDVIAACHARYPDAGLWPGIEHGIAQGPLGAPIARTLDLPGDARLDLQVISLGRGHTMLTLAQHQAGHLHLASLKTG